MNIEEAKQNRPEKVTDNVDLITQTNEHLFDRVVSLEKAVHKLADALGEMRHKLVPISAERTDPEKGTRSERVADPDPEIPTAPCYESYYKLFDKVGAIEGYVHSTTIAVHEMRNEVRL